MSQEIEYFGKYILLERLNAGGMAEVFLALASGNNGVRKFLAVKRILPQFSDNEEFIDMFKTEANIAVNLSHSNIVSIYEFGKASNQLFLAMDYLEGRTLRQILTKLKKSGRYLSTEQIVFIIKEIAAGLDHAHRCLDNATGKPLNIIHRDISPQNIMVSFEGEAKIIDFGIAKSETKSGEATQAGTLKGKYGYMSPEQVEGKELDLRTDVFSLGVILWELCAKDRLFIANNEINTLKKVRDCHIPSLRKVDPNISPELERIILKALAKDRNKRYQTSAELNRDLNRFLNRQYPDFSTHDFSAMMKSLYADKILETRKRQVEYFKISGPNVSETTNTDISMMETDSKFNDLAPNFENLDFSDGKPLGLNFDPQETAFNFSNLELKDSLSNERKSISKKLKIEDSDNNDKSIQQKKINDFKSQITRKTNPNFNIQPKSNFSISTVASYLIMLVLFSGGAFIGYKKYFNPKIEQASNQNIPKINVSNKVIKNTPQKISGPEIIPIIVNSRPSGASIYVDGKNTGKITPSRISVPAEKLLTIRLEKKDYIAYTKTDVAFNKSTSRSVNATLQKLSIAYVDIEVSPSKNARIYINGQRLTEKRLPIKKYAVPALTNLKIEAYDPVENKFAEKIVKLNKGVRQSYKLILKKSNRKPSQAN